MRGSERERLRKREGEIEKGRKIREGRKKRTCGPR